MEDSRRFLKTLRQEYQIFWRSLRRLFDHAADRTVLSEPAAEFRAKKAKQNAVRETSSLNPRLKFQLPRAVIMGESNEDFRLRKKNSEFTKRVEVE